MNCQDQQMFCYQCEQTAKNTGCTYMGICGKTPNVASLQDLLIHALKGLAFVAQTARNSGVAIKHDIGFLICSGLFTTVTNVDFSEEAIIAALKTTINQRNQLLEKLPAGINLPDAATFTLKNSTAEFINQGKIYRLLDKLESNHDIQSLKNTLLFGINLNSAVEHYSSH